MTHAEAYAEHVSAYNAQIRHRYSAGSNFDQWADRAPYFRFDPLSGFSAGLQILASHLKPHDVLIDVGGGGGRVSLAMAPRCKEVLNVEPSPAMGAQFEEARADAAIDNARWIHLDWVDSQDIKGDLTFARNVTYFVPDIETFIDKMMRAASKRVIISIASTPPPNQSARLAQLVYEEAYAPVPGHRELLPVLWDMGILPEILIPAKPPSEPSSDQESLPKTRERAVESALQGVWLNEDDRPRAQKVIEEHFSELFLQVRGGFKQLWNMPSRELIITWETSHS